MTNAYERCVLPRLLNAACGVRGLQPLRRRACAGLTGQVLELGFGTGLNLPCYPAEVTGVAAIEPSDLSWKLAGKRIAAAPFPVARSGLDGQSLSFPDGSFEGVLSTWTLCTIPDAAAALSEVRRVLRPGGRLHFLEHGLAPDERVRRWQRFMDPIQVKVAGGCHFTRPIADMLTDAGFEITALDEFYEGRPKFAAADSLGIAVSPALAA